MLTHIYIRDLVTISELALNLQHGCSMITGETGAGKSIFIEAIQLGLGGRASVNLIRAHKERAEISLIFNISAFAKVIQRLIELDLYQDNEECIIRRIITLDGRSRCYVNGSPVNVQLVRELGDLLFHLHSQHDQQVLLKSDTQREMLDRYADALEQAQQVKTYADQYRVLTQAIETLTQQAADRTAKCEFIKFQLEELNTVALTAEAWSQLESEHHRLTHQGDFMGEMSQIKQLLAENDSNILAGLTQIQKNLNHIAVFQPLAKNWLETLNQAIILLNDMNDEMTHELENIDLDPQHLQQLEQRLSQIFTLSRKYKIAPEGLAAHQASLQAELDQLEHSEENLAALRQEQQAVIREYTAAAKALSALREEGARKLENQINPVIRSLSLPHGEFKIALLNDEYSPYPANGQEKIQFLIKTNPDQPLQALAKVVSGGELSRLSLAAHLALADHTTIPTLIFDEIDTGVSGGVAEKIGKLLRKLAKSYQVFCITHQAQVAAWGEHHLLVMKTFSKNTTNTHIKCLDKHDKEREIARMLGGEHITAKTLAHAKEVIKNI